MRFAERFRGIWDASDADITRDVSAFINEIKNESTDWWAYHVCWIIFKISSFWDFKDLKSFLLKAVEIFSDIFFKLAGI